MGTIIEIQLVALLALGMGACVGLSYARARADAGARKIFRILPAFILLALPATTLAQAVHIDRDNRNFTTESRGYVVAHLMGRCAVSKLPFGARVKGLAGSDFVGGLGLADDTQMTASGKIHFYADEQPWIDHRVIQRSNLRPLKSLPYSREVVTPDKFLVVKVPFLKSAMKEYTDEAWTGLHAPAGEIARFVKENPKAAKGCGLR